MGVGGQHHVPAALPPGKTLYPLYRKLGGPHGRSGRVRKISPLPGFDPQTVHSVASRYTDWAIAAHPELFVLEIKIKDAVYIYIYVLETHFLTDPLIKYHAILNNDAISMTVLFANEISNYDSDALSTHTVSILQFCSQH